MTNITSAEIRHKVDVLISLLYEAVKQDDWTDIFKTQLYHALHKAIEIKETLDT